MKRHKRLTNMNIERQITKTILYPIVIIPQTFHSCPNFKTKLQNFPCFDNRDPNTTSSLRFNGKQEYDSDLYNIHFSFYAVHIETI